MFKYFTGIDISLEKFNFCIIDNEGKIIKKCELPHSYEGFIKLKNTLERITDKEKNIIGIESSGPYHINILSFLVSNSFKTTLFNPIILKNFNKSQTIRRTKTDRIDAKTIAFFMLKNQDIIKVKEIPESLKLLAREREEISKEIAKIKNRIKALVFNIFKELLDKYNIFTQGMLEFLLNIPSARIARIKSEEEIREILSKISEKRGRKISITPEDIKKIANRTISIDDEKREIILKSRIRMLLNLQKELKILTEEFMKRAEEFFRNEIEIISSIKGIGKLSAAIFLAETEGLKNIRNVKKLRAFCGMDPIIFESGKFKGKSRISKRGNRHIRRIIWNMAQGAVFRTNTFKTYFKRKRNQGMKYKKALVATANKLLSVIFALVKNNSTFHDLPPTNFVPVPNYS